MTRLLLVFIAVVSCCGFCVAQGGPPLLTDDPGTVERGKWEVNLAWINRTMHGRQENEIPHFDANRGISDRAHFKIEIPYVFATENRRTLNGDGGGSVGVKYRFLDEKGSRPAISTYPQLGFRLAPRSVRLGLSEGGTSLLLPLEVQWGLRGFNLNVDSGLIVQEGEGLAWLGGAAIGHQYKDIELLAEIHGEGNLALGETNWVGQLGLRHDFNKQATLLFAFGKTLYATRSDRLSWTSYLGIQFHY